MARMVEPVKPARNDALQQPKSNPALFGALVARLLLEEVKAGRWQKLPDGRLAPVDAPRPRVVECLHRSREEREEERHAAV